MSAPSDRHIVTDGFITHVFLCAHCEQEKGKHIATDGSLHCPGGKGKFKYPLCTTWAQGRKKKLRKPIMVL